MVNDEENCFFKLLHENSAVYVSPLDHISQCVTSFATNTISYFIYKQRINKSHLTEDEHDGEGVTAGLCSNFPAIF